MTIYFILVAASYLSGSIPTAYLLGRGFKGIDIREHGSGNCGATNVFRVIGKGAGILALFLDTLKGLIPVFFTLRFFPGHLILAVVVGLAAILGHNWTCFLKFKGGKGVATSCGVFLALIPIPTLIAMGFFLIGFIWTHHVSVGSLLGSASLPLSAYFFKEPKILIYFTCGCVLLIFILHKKNIERIIKGEESKINLK